MGFALYKLLGQLIRPLPLALAVTVLALLLPWPCPARLTSASSLTLLALLSLPATGLTRLRRLAPPLQLQPFPSLPPADVVVVLAATSSRTTAEGGRAFRRLAAEHGWRSAHLVSASFHLGRALRHYQSEGVRLTPVACPELRLPTAAARASRPLHRRAHDWLPSAEGLRWSTSAIKEWLGRRLAP